MKPVRTFVSALFAIVAPVAAVAQNTVTLNATSGTNVIANGYSTSGGLTLNMGFLMDVLAVGGGGGGGARFGGGGGAGGVLHQTNVVLGGTAAPSQTIGVVVGSGGTGGVASGGGGTDGAGSGGNGGNSLFGNLTGFGGGGGGRGDAANGAAGGSGGGGAGRFASSGGTGTAGQGNAGGSSTGAIPFGGAGGGGASAAGATAGSGAAGGAGRAIDISGASVTYGGGGGGGGSAAHSASGNVTASPGAGGSGGGGRGGNADNSLPAIAGTANTGGGGGGSAYNPAVQQYAAAGGGSGIVIVRYQGSAAGTGGTVTSGTGTAAGYTLHTFTTTGSTNLDLSSLNLNTRLGAKVTGVITGNGPLTYNGPGTLILSNNSTFSGSTTITAGTLQLGDGSTQGAINSSAVVNNGTLIFNRSNALRFEAVVSGSGSLIQQGTGRTTLSGSNTFSGGTTINAGSVATTSANRLPTQGLVTVGGSTSLTLGGNQTLGGLAGTGTVSIAGFRLTLGSSSGTFAGRVLGTGGITKEGAGTLTLSGSNSFTGDTFVNGGTLVIANTRALDPFAIVTTATGGTLQVNQNTRIGYYENSGSLTGSGTLTSAYTLTNTGTLSAPIADDGGASGVLKRTSGTSVLDAANTYTGPTRIQAGRLELGTAGSVASTSSLIVEPTGEFATNGKSPTFSAVQNNGLVALGGGTASITQVLSGTGTIYGNVAVTGLHSPGNSPGVEEITGNLAYGTGAGVLWELTGNTTTNSPVVYDQIVVGGDLTFSSSTGLTLSFDSAGSLVDWGDTFWDTSRQWTLWDVAGTTSSFGNLSLGGTNWLDGFGIALGDARPQAGFSVSQQGSDVVLTYSAVPEPSSLVLTGLGMAAAAVLRRRRG